MTINKNQPIPTIPMTDLKTKTAPEPEHLKGEVIMEMALDADGQPIDDTPENWAAADAAEPQPVSIGTARFRVIDHDARELAEQLGAIDPDHPDGAQLLVELHSDEPNDALTVGRYVAIEATNGIQVTFVVWCSTFDRDAPTPPGFDLGEQAQRNAALDSLGSRQALLIQVFGEGSAQ